MIKLWIFFACDVIKCILLFIISPLWNKVILPLRGSNPQAYKEVNDRIIGIVNSINEFIIFFSKQETSVLQELIPFLLLTFGLMFLLIFLCKYEKYDKRFWRWYGLFAIFWIIFVLFIYLIWPM